MKISLDKKYRTVDGRPVIIHSIKEEVRLFPTVNHPKGEVIRPTYPVKGSIINPGKKKPEYQIWSIEGITDVVWGRFANQDLVEEK